MLINIMKDHSQWKRNIFWKQIYITKFITYIPQSTHPSLTDCPGLCHVTQACQGRHIQLSISLIKLHVPSTNNCICGHILYLWLSNGSLLPLIHPMVRWIHGSWIPWLIWTYGSWIPMGNMNPCVLDPWVTWTSLNLDMKTPGLKCNCHQRGVNDPSETSSW